MAEDTQDNQTETKSAKNNKEELQRLEIEAKQLEIDAKKLELLERAANLQDVKERLADRELKREDRQHKFKNTGQALKSIAAGDLAAQTRCNHRKGGQGADGIIGGRGDDNQYAVLKHTMLNNDMWIRCLRCGKTWKPPVRKFYTTEEAYLEAFVEYKNAKEFQTRNIPSTSMVFQWSDGGTFAREQMASTTLR